MGGQGECYHGGHYFMPGALLEIHHLDGQHSNGLFRKLAAVHRHCHNRIHGKDSRKGSVDDSNGSTEEPDEANGSRPVLQTTTPGDRDGEFTWQRCCPGTSRRRTGTAPRP
jgi:RNA-directed DNA polymerase